MLRSTWLLVALFVISVLPTTAIALLLATIGLPFWLAGLGDLLLGKAPIHAARLDMSLLFITAPLGLVGVYSLWRVFWTAFRRQAIDHPSRLALGLLAGLVAGTHLLIVKVPLLVLALPATLFAVAHLRAAHRSQKLERPVQPLGGA